MQTRRHHKQQSSSLNTTLSLPSEGLLLNLLGHQESESEFQLQINNQILNNPQIKRQTDYNLHYNQDILTTDKMNYSNSLDQHRIHSQVRAKMVDWMIEVFICQQSSVQTYFRTINIMDAFLKYSIQSYSDSDMYLLGITCIFISSKLEDLYHISLQSIIQTIGHDKFTHFQVKDFEQQILETLNYNIYFPSTLEYLEYINYIAFGMNDNPALENIKETSLYVLKMVMHDHELIQLDNMLLTTSIFGYVIREYILANSNHMNTSIQNQLFNIQNTVIDIGTVDLQMYLDSVDKIALLVLQFRDRYPNFINLQRFQ